MKLKSVGGAFPLIKFCSVGRVESSITKHVLIIEHFSTFSSFLRQIEDFWVIGCANWRVTNVFQVLQVKKQNRKRMSDSLLQFQIKNSFRPLPGFSLISSSFLVHFE
jgi:hypothetical protein